MRIEFLALFGLFTLACNAVVESGQLGSQGGALPVATGGQPSGTGGQVSSGIGGQPSPGTGGRMSSGTANGGRSTAVDFCGNGAIEFAEECDDGNRTSGDCCNSLCDIEPGCVCPAPGQPCIRTSPCGDGILQAGEECDDGRDNGDYGTCNPNCTLAPYCGDGKADSAYGEQCDLGSQNGTVGSTCAANCQAIYSPSSCSLAGGTPVASPGSPITAENDCPSRVALGIIDFASSGWDEGGLCCAPSKACGARAGDTCSNNEYCAYQTGAYCGAADAEAICVPRPQTCADYYAPVCGCDQKTYANTCLAAAAGTGVYSNGACSWCC